MKRQRPSATKGPVIVPIRRIAQLLNVPQAKVREAVDALQKALKG